ncbi:3-dehydroquinate synthase [Candidatus Magnetoovum chiemensis]|nr:3-dehydroquinate synthase [Candidatus Magnetoovum chiemensis]
MEILIPSILRIKPHCLHKIGKYLRKEGLNYAAVFFGEGVKEMFYNQIDISFESSEINNIYEEVVLDNDIDSAFSSSKKLPGKTKAIVAIGGGKAIDYCKYVSLVSRLPLISIPTITSNDGFCSPLSSLTVNGRRKTVKTVIPYGVIVDTTIIMSSPQRFIYSGIGDLFCKLTALFDWRLAYNKTGEYVNDFAATISSSAVDTFRYYKDKRLDNDEYIGIIASALLFNGLAMEIAQSSRPASGSEHLISHAYDKYAKKPSLHGLQVGAASYAVSYLQKEPYERVKEIIKESGFLDFMSNNKLDKADFIKAVEHASEIKEDFYTILSEKHSIENLLEFIETDDIMNMMLG